MRDSSPPEAMRASGRGGSPGLGAKRKTTWSMPSRPKSIPPLPSISQRAAGAAAPFERHGEARAGEPEILELPFDPLGQRPPPLLAGGGERQRRLAIGGEGGGDLRRQLVAVVVVPFELGELGRDLGAPGEDRAGIAAVLAEQALDGGQPLLDEVEPRRIGLQAVEPVAQRARRLLQADARLVDLRLQAAAACGSQASTSASSDAGPCRPLDRRVLLLEQQREGGAERDGDRLGVAQHVALRPQLHLLAGARLGGVDLGGLEAEEVDPLAAHPVVPREALQPLGEARRAARRPRPPGRGAAPRPRRRCGRAWRAGGRARSGPARRAGHGCAGDRGRDRRAAAGSSAGR